MKLFQKFFTKQPSINNNPNKILSITETQKLTSEIEKLKKLENKYKNKLDELVEEKILLQIKINELTKMNQECMNCNNLNKEITNINKSKEVLFQTLSNLKTLIKIEKNISHNKEGSKQCKDIIPISKEENFPDLEKYFVSNGKYYLLDKDENLYILKQCTHFKEFMEGSDFENMNIHDIIEEYFRRDKE